MNHPIPYFPDVETIPPDEEEDIQQVIAVMRELLARDERASGLKRRDVHVKSHGAPLAQFQVLPGLPEQLQQSLFAEAGHYSALLRFSSSSPWPKPDAVPDARGVAIKIQGIPGDAVQDFIMINQPAFIARNVKDYLRIQRARLQPTTAIQTLTGGNWDPRQWHWREILTTANLLTQIPRHPACQTYYSMVPIRFGNFIVKYRLRLLSRLPATSFRLFRELATHTDAFRIALAETLRTTALTFEFQVQLQTNPRTMPIEDASVIWPEAKSPFQTVAHVLVPRQELESTPQGLGDGLSFSVWNAMSDHRPLGGINRVRKTAYEVSAAWRGLRPHP